MRKNLYNKKFYSGFTLIELLIVIAVLGVLAAVVLVAINPLEQLARGRDAGRKNAAGQLSNAIQSYYTSHNAAYVTASPSWIDALVAAGELKNVPANSPYSKYTTCSNGSNQGGYCYYTNGTDAVVNVRLESASEVSKCTGGVTDVYYAWTSQNSRAGVVCGTPGSAYTFASYIP